MTVNVTTPRTRRSVIAGAIGGTVALAAGALGQPEVARAGTDGDVRLGQMNTTGASTIVQNTGAGGVGVKGQASATTGTGFGLFGSSKSPAGAGVWGAAESATGGIGVLGEANSAGGVGVQAAGDTYAVWGAGASTGVFGSSGIGTGVIGWSQNVPMGTAPHPTTPAKTGGYGYAAHDAAAMGVYGQSTAGRGVQGVATRGYGVCAAATTGTGVRSTATTGIAGWFKTGTLKSGTALWAIGKVRFDNSVGLASCPAGASSVTVTPGIDLTATSVVVATLQGSAGGTTCVRCVTVNATADTFTIVLTAKSLYAVKIAWHVFG